jgi:hypothetical protein
MQKLARLLACSGVLATVALSAPGAALAAPALASNYGVRHPVHEKFKPDGTVTSAEKYAKTGPRTTVDFEPSGENNVDGGTCMTLYGFHSRAPLSREICGNGKLIIPAAGIPPDAEFFVQWRKLGNGSHNNLDGTLDH